MKKLYLIGNLKMNMDSASIKRYLKELLPLAEDTSAVVGVCVPFVYLPLAQSICENTDILIGAQNMHYEKSGAFTGEISPVMLNDFATNLVLIGHSERRQFYGENNHDVAKKIKAALSHGITPILCVGETLSEREAGKTNKVLKTQMLEAVQNLSGEELARLWLAYEPVWAIGTGVSASSSDAEGAIAYIKQLLAKLHPNVFVPVLYGGSLKPTNAKELLSVACIDGGLIGGASLDASTFAQVINTEL